jgi:hypothetical protein
VYRKYFKISIMKKNCLIIPAVILLFLQSTEAQVKMGMYGTHTSSVNSSISPDVGNSFSLNFLSVGDTISEKKKTPSIVMQVGGELYYSGLGRRTFYDVPLLAPQIGLSKVILSNSLLCVNAMSRFSMANRSIFTPYIEMFAGYRSTSSKLQVIPYLHNYEQPNTKQTLASVSGINYGFGGGILTSLGKQTKFDVGVSYAEALQGGGSIANLNSAYADAGGINLNLKDSPNGIFMFHVGLIFYLEKVNISMNAGRSESNYDQKYFVPINGGSIVSGTCSPPPIRSWGPGSYPSRTSGNSGNGIISGGSGNWGSNTSAPHYNGNNGGGSHVGVHIGNGNSGGHVGGNGGGYGGGHGGGRAK